MQDFVPFALTRKKAMLFTGFGKVKLETLVRKGIVRHFKTCGGHKRYFRDDLIPIINAKSRK